MQNRGFCLLLDFHFRPLGGGGRRGLLALPLLHCVTILKMIRLDTSSPTVTLTFICCLNCAMKFPSFWNLFFTEEPFSLELDIALTSLDPFGSLIPALAFLMSSSSCFFLSFSSICTSR